MSKLNGFGSDGASAVANTKEGMAGKLERMQPNIVTLHCIANKLQLCFSQAAEQVKFLKSFQRCVLSPQKISPAK